MANRLFRLFFLTALVLAASMAKAQFKVVDAQTREPLPGVYVCAENGTMLAMSDSKGMVRALNERVTLSMLSYESQTIDARNFKGEVAMQDKAYDLPDIVVGRTDFIKISAVFRDVVTNFGKVVVYREGLADYYYDTKSKKYTRYVRACRQYEHPDLRKHVNDSLAVLYLPLINYNTMSELERTGDERSHGDTTFVGALRGKKRIEDGVMNIEKDGKYRVVIDAIKFLKRTDVGILGIHYSLKKRILDWQYNDKPFIRENIVAFREYREERFKWSKKAVEVPIVITSEFVIDDIAYLKKDKAKEEMKSKGTTTKFTLPNRLPAAPKAVTDQVAHLVLKKFREIFR